LVVDGQEEALQGSNHHPAETTLVRISSNQDPARSSSKCSLGRVSNIRNMGLPGYSGFLTI
jgi:hypothetical protein